MRVYVCKGARGSRVALGGIVGDGGEGRKGIEGRGKSVVVAGFGGRNPLRAISGRAVFRGSQNGRHPHQDSALG